MPDDDVITSIAVSNLENEEEGGMPSRKFIDGLEIFPDTLLLMSAAKKHGQSTQTLRTQEKEQ